MNTLSIEVAENGFIVSEGRGHQGMTEKRWAFEKPEALANFIKEWGEEKDRSNIGKVASTQ